MTIVEETFAALAATLAPVASAPGGSLEWGTDLSCADDLSRTLVEVDAGGVDGIREALYRRLITPRGRLIDDPDYGFDVVSVLNDTMGDSDLRALAGAISNEITKDDRVDSADVTVKRVTLSEYTIRVDVTPVDPVVGDFSLVMTLTDGAMLLEAL